MIGITIDHAGATPPYEQLRDELISRIVSGELDPGTKLPSVRALATELGLAANTVARSYKELEAAGFVQTQGRNGTLVAPRLGDAEQHRRGLEVTSRYVAAMSALGFEREELDGFLRRV